MLLFALALLMVASPPAGAQDANLVRHFDYDRKSSFRRRRSPLFLTSFNPRSHEIQEALPQPPILTIE